MKITVKQEIKMALKQREANRKALEMAVAIIDNSDLESLFADLGDDSPKDYEILSNAKDYAVRRIQSLIKQKT